MLYKDLVLKITERALRLVRLVVSCSINSIVLQAGKVREY